MCYNTKCVITICLCVRTIFICVTYIDPRFIDDLFLAFKEKLNLEELEQIFIYLKSNSY